MLRLVKRPLLVAAIVCVLTAMSLVARADDLTNLPPALRPPPTLRDVAPHVAARMSLLDRELRDLGRRGEGRFWGGVIQAGIGATLVGVGAALHDEIARSLLLMMGATLVARGTVQLTLVPDAPERARAFRAISTNTADGVRARIRYGEQAFAELARGGRRARIGDGTISMVTSAAYVPLFWWLERRNDPSYHFGDGAYDYVALALSGIGFATGVVTAAVSSDVELRYRDYCEARDRLEQANPGELERLRFSAGPRPGGFQFGAEFRF